MQSIKDINSDNSNIVEDLVFENTTLIKEIHKLQLNLEQLYNDKQSVSNIKGTIEISEPIVQGRVYYGAGDRIKADLPYRLGSKIISTPLKPKAIAKLPLDILLEYKKFRDKENQSTKVDLQQYKDAHEAEKVKNHLSYKVGNTVVEGLSSPTKFVKMPIKLAKEFIIFKKKR